MGDSIPLFDIMRVLKCRWVTVASEYATEKNE